MKTPKEWAAWVITGDPYGKIPQPFEPISIRLQQAIVIAIQEEWEGFAKKFSEEK